MPRSPQQANPKPRAFALCVIAAYAAACLPLLARRQFDPSVFVVAGARYVNAAQTNPPLRVKPNSDGYDGQFYYRLAAAPASALPAQAAIRVDGIAFDHPAKRIARILYPLLAWAISGGQPALTAWAMLAVNLAGIGAIAWLAATTARRQHLPAWVPLAIVLWPGFIVALLHDTTEITAAAFLLAALAAWQASRPAAYAGLACCAVLTRETTLAPFIGLLAWSAATTTCRTPAWLLAGAAPLAATLAWHTTLALSLPTPTHPQPLSHDIGWPFLGALRMLHDCLLGGRTWAIGPFKNAVARLTIILSALPLLAFCTLAATRLAPMLRRTAPTPLAAAWLTTAALMSLLTARGPWTDPIAYLRAFTECFVLGCLLLGATGFKPRLATVARIGIAEWLLAWAYTMVQFR